MKIEARIRIKEALEKRSMLQKDLVELTGMRPNAISSLARGNNERVSLDHLSKIASALNIEDMNELIELVKIEDGKEFEDAFNYGSEKYKNSFERLKDK
ncbi:helix-turn-helix transcriptional regulator [Priestia megaterium]|uniref:helix-turn-helix domain-containing protein n=1 Tax=Priestia megaterium TaxID=1404 RepID=UPI0020409253|nr:helix-turn-helix transcriptional regulator [Priestia megaterium]MCM3792480.1 helix-turn-helix transcriptional regulator [Priestia megaterium]